MLRKLLVGGLLGVAALAASASSAFAGGFEITNSTSYGTMYRAGSVHSIEVMQGTAREVDLSVLGPNAGVSVTGNGFGSFNYGGYANSNTNVDPSFALTVSESSFARTTTSGESFHGTFGINSTSTAVNHWGVGVQ